MGLRCAVERVALVLSVLLLLCVAGAQDAQAGLFETETGESATVTGQQISEPITGKLLSKHEFVTKAGVVKCTAVTFHGVAAPESEALTLTPTYSECTIAGVAATVQVNGCDYLLHAWETSFSEDQVAALVDIKCTLGSIEVKVVGSKCVLKVGGQSGVPGLELETTTNGFPKPDVDVWIDITSITYSIENGSSCPNAPASGVYPFGGSYRGVATLKAEQLGGGAAVGLTVT